MERKTYKIDAEGKILGRLAVKLSILLRGKYKPEFVSYKDMGDFVIIKNIKKIKVTGKKMDDKIYYHHSGYLGGMKKTPMKRLFKKDPSEILKKAVFGLIPNNKLRNEQLKRLKFE